MNEPGFASGEKPPKVVIIQTAFGFNRPVNHEFSAHHYNLWRVGYFKIFAYIKLYLAFIKQKVHLAEVNSISEDGLLMGKKAHKKF